MNYELEANTHSAGAERSDVQVSRQVAILTTQLNQQKTLQACLAMLSVYSCLIEHWLNMDFMYFTNVGAARTIGLPF